LLVAGCLLLLIAVALAANYGPVRRYQDARGRLEKATAGVATLAKQKAELQSQVSKLGQARYLEGLARQELSYARPGEDLYIVTGLGGDQLPATTSGDGSPEAPTGLGIGASGLSVEKPQADGSAGPGILERILSAISGLF